MERKLYIKIQWYEYIQYKELYCLSAILATHQSASRNIRKQTPQQPSRLCWAHKVSNENPIIQHHMSYCVQLKEVNIQRKKKNKIERKKKKRKIRTQKKQTKEKKNSNKKMHLRFLVANTMCVNHAASDHMLLRLIGRQLHITQLTYVITIGSPASMSEL